MKTTVLDYIESSLTKDPNKLAVKDSESKITYKDFINNAKLIASNLLKNNVQKGIVAIFMDKTAECLESMIGCVYSHNTYCVLDINAPAQKINTIINILKPDVILTDSIQYERILKIYPQNSNILKSDNLTDTNNQIDEEYLKKCRKNIIDTDPVYILFTSGSTGIPKGTVITHKAIISYINAVIEVFKFTSDINFGSQTPFFFSMSVLDIYVTLFSGGTLTIIPKMLFSFPVKLIRYMNEKKINAIYWVPTALSIVANRKTFSAEIPLFLKYVLFAGEVMPLKQLNYWINNLPEPLYANLYGPTEITDTGTYYIVNRKFFDNEQLPIGIPFPNCDVILLTEDNTRAKHGNEGEICFRGSFLGSGYFDNWEKTNEVFCQNPLNKHYIDLIYRTGDIGKYNEFNELLYISRKDFQIKKSGYRIELGDIEGNAQSIDGINECVCIFDKDKSKIILFYIGNIDEQILIDELKNRIAVYMLPDKYIKVQRIPKNANGKFDRIQLLTEYKNGNFKR